MMMMMMMMMKGPLSGGQVNHASRHYSMQENSSNSSVHHVSRGIVGLSDNQADRRMEFA